MKLDARFFNLMNDLYLCAVYIHPQHSMNQYSKKTDYFQCLNESVMKYGNQGNIMIAGDLNSRIGVNHDRVNHELPIIDNLCPDELKSSNRIKQRLSCDVKVNCYGKKLLQLCQGFNLKFANGAVPGDRLGSFTCHANRGASVLDYVICDHSLFNIVSRMIIHPPQFGSVHSPITTCLDNKFQVKTSSESSLPPPPRIKWDDSRSEAFLCLLNQNENLNRIKSLEIKLNRDLDKKQLEECTHELTDILFSNASKCFKIIRRRKFRPRKPKSKPWYNNDCVSMKRRLRNLSKLLLKSPKDPVIRGNFIKIKKEYKKTVKQYKKAYEISNINQLEELTNQPKKFWEHLKKIGNASKFGLGYGNYISKETWLDHFRSLNNRDPAVIHQNMEYCKNIENGINGIIDTNKDDPICNVLENRFSVDEINFGIKQLKKGKASGTDAISNDIIKTSKSILTPTLALLFNKIVELKYFPIIWSTGMIVPIHKSGELDDPDNFRGITLNSCVSKLFTYILNVRLTFLCEDKGLIDYNQIGFRKGFRTADHVFTLKTLVDKTFVTKKKLYTCFVDFKKAYDTVWRNGLFFKLLKLGISTGFVQLIRDMYSKLQSCVHLQGGVSTTFDSLVGLKQGCNLSPLLFNLFVNDIISDVNRLNKGVPHLENLQVSCLLYADDLVLLSETKEGLQESLNALDQFTKQWFLEVNPKKTKCLTFTRGRYSKEPDTFELGDIILENCDSYCYLGVIFCRSGSMKMAAKALHDKALGAMFSILRNINKHHACKFNILIDLFDKMILPIAFYNSEVWGTNFISTNLNNNEFFDINFLSRHIVESLQFKFLKMILGVSHHTSNWGTLSETGRFPIIIKVFTFMIKYFFHLKNSPSDIVTSALATNMNLAHLGVNSWFRSIERILKFCHLDYLLYTSDSREIYFQLSNLKKKLSLAFIEKWSKDKSELLKTNNRLGIFLSIKDQFEISRYLTSSRVPLHRIALTKLRLSAHRLPIETGRYEQIPREDRSCPFGCDQLGNEQHYFFQCKHPFIMDLRKPFINQLILLENTIQDMGDEAKLRTLLKSTSNEVISLFGSLSFKLLNIFKELTT